MPHMSMDFKLYQRKKLSLLKREGGGGGPRPSSGLASAYTPKHKHAICSSDLMTAKHDLVMECLCYLYVSDLQSCGYMEYKRKQYFKLF